MSVHPQSQPQEATLIEALLEELYANDSLHIACPDFESAATITKQLAEATDETLHTEQRPVTDDDAGTVEYVALAVRKLHHSDDVGWTSADVANTPDIDLRPEPAQ